MDFKEFEPKNFSDWSKQVEKELKGKDFDSHLSATFLNDISIPAYQDKEGLSELPFPVEEIQNAVKFVAANESKKGYTIGVDDAKAANKRALNVLKQGVNALLFQINTPTVAAADLLKDIDGSLIEIGIEGNYQDLSELVNACNFDKKQSVCLYISPFQPGFEIATFLNDFTTWNKELSGVTYCFQFNPLAAAGANFSLQIAAIRVFVSNLVALAASKGIDIKTIAEKTTIGHGFSTLFFAEIAKSRAIACSMLSIYNNELAQLENITPLAPKVSVNPLFTGNTDPEVNLIRLSAFAFAAYAANPSCILVNNYKNATDGNTDRISANVLTIAEEESYLSHYKDPSAGSYYVETLTQKLMMASEAIVTQFPSNLQWSDFLKNTTFTSLLNDQAQHLQNNFKEGKVQMIGENLYPPNGKEKATQLHFETL